MIDRNMSAEDLIRAKEGAIPLTSPVIRPSSPLQNSVEPTPSAPSAPNTSDKRPEVKPATPDLLNFDETLPIELLSDLLFENIGGIEILTVSRRDLVNGQRPNYSLIANSATLAATYAPNNFIQIPKNANDLFENFPIRFAVHVPDFGTASSKFYVGEENSFGCSGFPVLNKRTDEVRACFPTFQEANLFALAQQNLSIVYVEENTGNVVVDVLNIRDGDRVQLEVLESGDVQSDTIY